MREAIPHKRVVRHRPPPAFPASPTPRHKMAPILRAVPVPRRCRFVSRRPWVAVAVAVAQGERHSRG